MLHNDRKSVGSKNPDDKDSIASALSPHSALSTSEKARHDRKHSFKAVLSPETKPASATNKLKQQRKQTLAQVQSPLHKVHTGTLLRREQGEQHNRRGLENRFLHNNPVQAIADFSRAILLVPEEPTYYWHRAEAYLAVMDFDSCLTDFRQHIVMVAELRTKTIINKPLESVYVTRHRMSRIVFLWGQCLLDQYRYREALDQFQLAEQLQFGSYPVTLRLAAAKIAHGRIDDALEGLYTLIQETPADPELYILRGKLYKLQNSADFVHISTQSAQKLAPEHPDLPELKRFVLSVAVRLKNLACEKELKNQPTLAIQFLNHAIQLDPEDVNLFIKRGSLFAQLENYESALEDLQSIMPNIESDSQKLNQVKITISSIFQKLGTRAYEHECLDDAIEFFTQAIENNPSEIKILSFRGDCYERKGDYDSALEDFLKVLKVYSSDEFCQVHASQLLYKKAIAFMTNGQYDDAIRYFDYAISCEPNNADHYYHRGRCHYYMDKIQDAQDDLNLSLQKNPYHQAAKSLLSSILPVPPMPDIAPLQPRKTLTKQDVFTMTALEVHNAKTNGSSSIRDIKQKGSLLLEPVLKVEPNTSSTAEESLNGPPHVRANVVATVTIPKGTSIPALPSKEASKDENKTATQDSNPSEQETPPNPSEVPIATRTRRPVIARVNPVLHEHNLSLDLSKLPSLFK